MIEVLHCLKDPKLWESLYSPYYLLPIKLLWVMQDFYHQQYYAPVISEAQEDSHREPRAPRAWVQLYSP